jgi:hypothetical protein
MYLVRRTFGFHRDRVEAGLRRIRDGIPGKDRGTGLHLESGSKAVKGLESRGLLVCERKSGGRTAYHIRLILEVCGKSEHFSVRKIRTRRKKVIIRNKCSERKKTRTPRRAEESGECEEPTKSKNFVKTHSIEN